MRVFAKHLFRENGRTRIALENPPVRRFSDLPGSKLVDVGDVAHLMGCTPRTIRLYVSRGFLKPRIRAAGPYGYLFTVSEVLRFKADFKIRMGRPTPKEIAMRPVPNQKGDIPDMATKAELQEQVDDLTENLTDIRDQLDEILGDDSEESDEESEEEE